MPVWYRLIGDTGSLSFLGCASWNGGGCRCGVFGGEDRFAAVIAMTLTGEMAMEKLVLVFLMLMQVKNRLVSYRWKCPLALTNMTFNCVSFSIFQLVGRARSSNSVVRCFHVSRPMSL